jgi:hypothetical protein
MLLSILSRRNLIAAAIGAGAAWLGERRSPLAACGDRTRSMSGYSALMAVSSDLRCPEAICQACLRALPAIEASPEDLTRLILADLSSADRDYTSAIVLRRSVRERSRDDFRDGKIITVDGWMLSLTETRVYALAALRAKRRVADVGEVCWKIPSNAHDRPGPSSIR